MKNKNATTKIKDVMSKNVEVVSPGAFLDEVAQKMQRRDCGCILVVNDDRVVGVITDRDIALRCVAESHHPAQTTAKQIMSSEILYCHDTDEADAVTKNMGDNKVRRLIVLNEEKRLVGMVTLGDLASHSNYRLCGEVLGQICRESSPLA